MDWLTIIVVGLIVVALALGWWQSEERPEGKMARLERELDNAEHAYRVAKSRHSEVLARLEIAERGLKAAKDRLYRARENAYAMLGGDGR